MSRPSRRALRGPTVAVLAVAAMVAGACTPDPPEPPDPAEVTPTVTCADGGPISLTRTTADTALPIAPWVQMCTLCPASLLAVELGDPDGDLLPSVTGWARGTQCAVSMPTVPIPEAGRLAAAYRVAEGEVSGGVTLEVVAGGARGENPPNLDGATFALEWDVARGRHPLQGDPRFIDPAPGPSLLVALGPADGEGSRRLTVGLTDATGDAQDLCVPTQEVGTATVSSRQIGGVLDAGAEILQPTPIPILRGAFQGRLDEAGAALFDITILGVVDPAPLEPLFGIPAEFCARMITNDGENPCGPCTDPSEGIGDEPPFCFTAVWEWAAAARADQPLQSVDADALPPECDREN